MLEMVLYGRGGQGVQLGGRIIATALFKAGYWVQSFASFGAEKRGAPVVSQVRVDRKPIRLRSDVRTPDLLGIFDPSLAGEVLAQYRLREAGVIVVNTGGGSDELSLEGHRLVAVDALEVAGRFGLGRLINSVMVGAIMGTADLVELSLLTEAVRGLVPQRREENAAACSESFRLARTLA